MLEILLNSYLVWIKSEKFSRENSLEILLVYGGRVWGGAYKADFFFVSVIQKRLLLAMIELFRRLNVLDIEHVESYVTYFCLSIIMKPFSRLFTLSVCTRKTRKTPLHLLFVLFLTLCCCKHGTMLWGPTAYKTLPFETRKAVVNNSFKVNLQKFVADADFR